MGGSIAMSLQNETHACTHAHSCVAHDPQMPWNKFFEAGFKQIDICDRTTKDDLRLDIAEDMGACGICVGSAAGLSAFCCLCQGVRYIYFGQKSSATTKSAQRGCSCCAGDVKEVYVPHGAPQA